MNAYNKSHNDAELRSLAGRLGKPRNESLALFGYLEMPDGLSMAELGATHVNQQDSRNKNDVLREIQGQLNVLGRRPFVYRQTLESVRKLLLAETAGAVQVRQNDRTRIFRSVQANGRASYDMFYVSWCRHLIESAFTPRAMCTVFERDEALLYVRTAAERLQHTRRHEGASLARLALSRLSESDEPYVLATQETLGVDQYVGINAGIACSLQAQGGKRR